MERKDTFMTERDHLKRTDLTRRALLRSALGVSAAIPLAGLLAACGSDDESAAAPLSSSTSSPLTDPSPTTSAAPATIPADAETSVTLIEETTEYRIVSHARGETKVPLAPQRIVSLERSLTDSLLAIGIMPVGTATTYGRSGHPPYVAETLAGVPVVGQQGDPNFEAILELAPDLILSWEFQGSGGPSYEQLSKITPTIVLDAPWFDGRTAMRDVGVIIGKSAEIETRLQQYEERIAETQDMLDRAIGDSTVAFMRLREKGYALYSATDYTGPLLYEDLELKPAPLAKESFDGDLSLEVLADLGADYLFITEENEDTVAEFKGSQIVQDIPAVRNGNVYAVELTHWANGSILANEAVMADLVEMLVDPQGETTQTTNTRVVTHFLGEIEIPASPQRIVLVDSNDLGALLVLGYTPVGAGVGGAAAPTAPKLEQFGAFYAKAGYAGEIESIEIVGREYEPNFEAIAALNPDVIIAPSWHEPEILEQIQKIAATLVWPRNGEDDDWTWDVMVRDFGYFFGLEDRAEEIIAEYQTVASQGTTILAAHMQPEDTVALLNFGEKQLRLYGIDSSNSGHVLYGDLGMNPAPLVPEDFRADISMEVLPELNVDYLFLRPWSASGDDYFKEVQEHPLWQTVPAVQKGQVYNNPDFFHMANNVVGRTLLIHWIVETITGEKIPWLSRIGKQENDRSARRKGKHS